MEQSVIYTDGHGVKVTTTEFITAHANYLIAGISRVRIHAIKASKIPGVVLLLLGLAAMVASAIHLFNSMDVQPFYIGTILLTANRVAFAVGLVLLLAGIISMAAMRDKYAVNITTAEGEKEPVVSLKQDYITQIVTALQKVVAYRKW